MRKFVLFLSLFFAMAMTAMAQEPVVSLTSEQLTSLPYQLSDEDAQKVFDLSTLTVVVKATTPSTMSGRKGLLCTSDPTQAANTQAMPTGSHYVAYGLSNENLTYLPSCVTGDRFSMGTVPTNSEVELAYVIEAETNFKSYLNAEIVQDRNFGNYEVATPGMVKADHSNAKIYIGGGVLSTGDFEVFDGTITGVKIYSGELTAEQIANAFVEEEGGEGEGGEGEGGDVTPTAVYYRVKSLSQGTYLNIESYNANNAGGPKGAVGLAAFAEDDEDQIFTTEDAGNGLVYLVSKNGYYIVCRQWNVDACNDGQKSALGMDYINDTEFRLMNGSQYFKVGPVDGGSDYYPYCDAALSIAETWVLEPVEEPVVPETPAIAQTAVFDFANNLFSIPSYEDTNYSGVRSKTVFTDGVNTIEIDPTANGGQFYYDNKGFLRIQKPGTKITLPAFAFDVAKIEVVGHASASQYTSVDMNIYANGQAVSDACVGSTGTNVFEIAEDAQAAGNIYELVLGSKGGDYSTVAYITYIKVYPKHGLQAPEFSVESGVYTQPFTVTVSSPTVAELEGVENVVYYYTTDGNLPTPEDEETDGEIEITESCTVNVIVEFDYDGVTYVSEATSAEYIISEALTYNRAVAVEAQNYFLVADNHVAGHYVNNVLPAVETTVNEDQITEAAYFLVTLERANDGDYYDGAYYIKDGAGNYLFTSSMYGTSGPKLFSNGAYVPTNAWEITVAEDGEATIECEGILLVYDAAAGAFRVCLADALTADMVKPTFYGVYETGIEGIVAGENEIESIYDLNGRKLEKVAAPGIYIVNGKKVLVK